MPTDDERDLTLVVQLGGDGRADDALVVADLTVSEAAEDRGVVGYCQLARLSPVVGVVDADTTRAPVVGVSPIVGGEVVRGMADRSLPVLGVEVSAEGVGRHYGARRTGGLLDAWLVHTGDLAGIPGVEVRSVPLLMSSPSATRDMAEAALDAAGACGGRVGDGLPQRRAEEGPVLPVPFHQGMIRRADHRVALHCL